MNYSPQGANLTFGARVSRTGAAKFGVVDCEGGAACGMGQGSQLGVAPLHPR